MTSARRIITLLFILCTVALVSCGDDENETKGLGTLNVNISAGEHIKGGIPAEMTEDGWAITIERYDLELEAVRLNHSETSASAPIRLAELEPGVGQHVASMDLPAGSYADLGIRVSRVEVEGSASKDGASITFNWGFDRGFKFGECDITVNVADGESTDLNITVLGGRLFANSLVSFEPRFEFQPLVNADIYADGDGVITRADLEWAHDIGSYETGTGVEGAAVENLWDWLRAQHKTTMQINNTGKCSGLDD